MASYQFSSEHPTYNHQNMAYQNGYMQPQWNPGFNANIHMPTPTYDPSTPSFQPNGMDIQRFQEPRTVPTPDMQKLQKYIVDTNVSQLTASARLERLTRGTAKEVEELRNALKHDLRILESRIRALQEDDTDTDDAVINQKTNKAVDTFSALNDLLNKDDDELLTLDLAPTQPMLDNFSTDRIADEYLDRADIMAKVVCKLRWHADELRGILHEKDAPSSKLIEAPPPTPGSKVIGFACCGTAYADIIELMAHVNEAHPDKVKPQLASDDGLHATPTRAPRSRNSKSRAVDIKAPVSKTNDVAGQILGSLMKRNNLTCGAREGATVARPVKVENEVKLEPESPAQPQMSTPAQVPNQPHVSIPTQAPTQIPIQPEHGTKWIPLAVAQMPERTAKVSDNTVTFSYDFLKDHFGGVEWSSGFYFNRKAGDEDEDGKPVGKAYWLLDPEHEPYLPEAPGKHGAKLTAFFNDSSSRGPLPDHYMNCPVFIKEKDSGEYRYYGTYSQTRYSDKVDYDNLMTHVPEHVRRYWAKELGEKGRPQWVANCLKNHFWPRPTYDGPAPTDSAIQTPATFATGEDSAGGIERRVTKAIQAYAEELKDHQKEVSLKMSLLTEDAIYESFALPDSDTEPGMRLWWEYFEFQHFDTELHDLLARMSKNPAILKASGKAGSKRPATPPNRGDRSTEMKAGALDEKEERKLKDFMPARSTTPIVRGTHQTSLKAGTIDKNNVQVVKPAPKTGSDVAAAVATLHKEATKKQAAIDSKARKAAIEQKQRDAARAPTLPSYPSFSPEKAPSRASAVPEAGLNGLGTWLLDNRKKAEGKKPVPSWGGGGDLNVAKQLNDEMTKAGAGSSRGNAAAKKAQGKGVPPHLRKK